MKNSKNRNESKSAIAINKSGWNAFNKFIFTYKKIILIKIITNIRVGCLVS